ncbi:CHAT domain-containing protein [Winogradskyella luteola]|uniref:CHAT domain-containing protein n=1 Tax=Winogradskyella luteola TaxID=2828330 RepID=A0A9X1JNQ9_9FLAO|nr:CHAT domain-containing protein [Winogradskyella luteola]MBV7269875.1 CHAT domain-containing protein [Winogradskyella luteola]
MVVTLRNSLYILYFFIALPLFAQQDSSLKLEQIDNFLDANQIKKADSALNTQINQLMRLKLYDSLYHYPLYIGKITLQKKNATDAVKEAKKFVDNLKSLTPNKRTLFRTYLSMDQLYLYLGDDDNCVIASKKALEYAESLADVKPKELGHINYVIGSNYYALYDLSNALRYFKQAVSAYEKSKDAKKSKVSDAHNGIAVSYWTLNKLDSAKIAFNKAIKFAEESELKGFDKLYYINAFKFNLALVLDDSGNVGEAIEMKKDIIKNLSNIIDNSKDEELVQESERLQSSAFSNLAAFYNDIGFVSKAYDMLTYAYKKKKLVYEPTSPRLATALYQIATAEIELKDLDKGIESINKALAQLKSSSNKYTSLEAEFLQLKARAYAEKGDALTATRIYEESEELYSQVYPTEYSRAYLIFLRDYALFLAENGEKEKAVATAKKSYNYVRENGGNDNFPLLKEYGTLANIYFLAKDYQKAYEWAEKGNTYLDNRIKEASFAMDSLQVEFRQPTFILFEAKSKYHSTSSRDEDFLLKLAHKLNQAFTILEKRKAITFDADDVSTLLSESKTVSDFGKLLYLELYNLTSKPAYLSKIIELHEAGIYNKIRTRLSLKFDVNFANIPKSIFEREKELKKELTSSLSKKDAKIDAFFKAEKSWEIFIDSLKISYPDYYKMRYAKIEADINQLQSKLPTETTVVRYLKIDGKLYAYVYSKTQNSLVALSSDGISELINSLNNNVTNTDEINNTLHELYNSLWFPIEDKVVSKRVIIIPDGELFNLSFEMMTRKKNQSLKEFSSNSLLSMHTISYNYSLLLLEEQRKTIDYSNDFIAFAPEFNREMKENYKISITDSLNIDRTYLTLLPQPFTVDLASEYSRLFNGESFINENASKQVFTSQAKEHKIIHIGTHAESNNISPELSRLIFAKNLNDESATDDNSLYTYEIYNQNLSSNLAILTACETGKPSYQSGEGMISLAHAFNYAGSESILTSLWKIDEQSSTTIIDNFYGYLKNGLPKDEALQKAKLDYIANAEGRTRSPQYWAGLVLIGDSSPIDLSPDNLWWVWATLILVIFLALYFFIRNRIKSRSRLGKSSIVHNNTASNRDIET